MKVVAYSIKSLERECLAKANHKKHDITLIANPLTLETVFYARGKEAAIVSGDDLISAEIIFELAALGIRYLITRSIVTDHINKNAAARNGVLVCGIPSNYAGSVTSLQNIANQTIYNLDIFNH
jgi:lactate dehydrogenase-like 2-hydroxyacid dehydrogenase